MHSFQPRKTLHRCCCRRKKLCTSPAKRISVSKLDHHTLSWSEIVFLRRPSHVHKFFFIKGKKPRIFFFWWVTIKTKQYPPQKKGPSERVMVTFAILMDQNKKIKKAVYTGYLIHRSFLKVKKDLVKKKGGGEASAKKKLLYHVNQLDIYLYMY